MFVCLCFMSNRQRVHLEMAPHLLSLAKDMKFSKYNVPTGNRTRDVAKCSLVNIEIHQSCTIDTLIKKKLALRMEGYYIR